MQANIVHTDVHIPSANSLIQELRMCIICRCARAGNILPHEPVAKYGQFVYDVYGQIPGYQYTREVYLCVECHLKVVRASDHDCSRCADGDRLTCRDIMNYLQSQNWNVCTFPRCRFCI